MNVYARLNGKLCKWEADTQDPLVARRMVASELLKERTPRPVFVVIDGGKAEAKRAGGGH